MLSALGLIQKADGGGLSTSGPMRKAEDWRRGVCYPLQSQCEKRGGGGGGGEGWREGVLSTSGPMRKARGGGGYC